MLSSCHDHSLCIRGDRGGIISKSPNDMKTGGDGVRICVICINPIPDAPTEAIAVDPPASEGSGIHPTLMAILPGTDGSPSERLDEVLDLTKDVLGIGALTSSSSIAPSIASPIDLRWGEGGGASPLTAATGGGKAGGRARGSHI